jgi:dTDP-4-dehydrorhamnose reductase
MARILLLGSTGFIGSQFKKALLERGYEIADPRVEITDLSQIRESLAWHKPDGILNCTGKTGVPNVDACEKDPQGTLAVNLAGSLNVAIAASEAGIYSAHMGTGCQYSGDNNGKGFSESDEPNYFGSLYTRSKILSEKAIREIPQTLQFRIRIPILSEPSPKNVIDKLLAYPKMINAMNSFSVVEDFIPAAIQLMERHATGVFNMTNMGAMDHVTLMGLYREIVDPKFKISLMPQDEQDELNKRRSNCVLNTDKRERFGVHMPPILESTRRALEKYKMTKGSQGKVTISAPKIKSRVAGCC